MAKDGSTLPPPADDDESEIADPNDRPTEQENAENIARSTMRQCIGYSKIWQVDKGLILQILRQYLEAEMRGPPAKDDEYKPLDPGEKPTAEENEEAIARSAMRHCLYCSKKWKVERGLIFQILRQYLEAEMSGESCLLNDAEDADEAVTPEDPKKYVLSAQSEEA
jgi:hypothetical protein